MNEPAAVPKLTLPTEAVSPDETGLFCIDGDHTLIDGHTHNRIYSAWELSKIIEENGGNKAEVDHVLEIIKAKTRSGELRLQPAKEWKSLFYTLMENNMWQRLLSPNKETRENAQWELVKHMEPVGGDPERWKSLFLDLIEEGHSVAMVSFSDYGKHILPRYLHEVIGLDQAFITEHIKIISFLPKIKKNTDKGEVLVADQSTKEKHISMAKEETGRINLSPEKIVFCDDDAQVLGKTCHDGGYFPVYADEEGHHIHVLARKCLSLKNPEMDAPVNKGTPCSSPRGETSPFNPLAALLLDADSSNSPSPPPKIFSSAEQLLRKSPSRAAMGRSSSECSLQSSGEYNNDPLRESFDGVKII